MCLYLYNLESDNIIAYNVIINTQNGKEVYPD